MKFHVITLFPEMFEGVFDHSIIKRAAEEKLIEINFVQLREFAVDKHGTVDDKPYGGGVGMLLMPKPIFDAVRSIPGCHSRENGNHGGVTERIAGDKNKCRIVLLTPRGKKLTQEKVREFTKLDEIIIICGKYEGVDERVHKYLADEEISIGDYVLSGGEIPAMVLIDSITRLIPGVLKKEEAIKLESFSKRNTVEYPQYTRPEDFEGMKVPEVLLSGDHKEIEKWRNDKSLDSAATA